MKKRPSSLDSYKAHEIMKKDLDLLNVFTLNLLIYPYMSLLDHPLKPFHEIPLKESLSSAEQDFLIGGK